MDDSLINSVQAQEFDPADLFKHGLNFLSSIDLIQGGFFRDVVGKTIIYLMCLRQKQDSHPLFSGATVILPPVKISEVNEESVHEVLTAGIEAMRGTTPNDKEKAFLKKYVRVIHCATLEASDLAELVIRESDGRFIAVVDGSKYRDASVSLPTPVGLSAVRMAEERWVPHVAGLCERCVEAVRQTESYLFIHVEETPPQNPELEAMLVAIEGCYISSIRVQDDPEEIIVSNFPLWVSWALGGKVDDAASKIQALKITELSRLLLMIQLMYRANRHDKVLELLQQLLPYMERVDKDNAVQVARIAYVCGDSATALKLLPKDPAGLGEKMFLETGLELGTTVEDNELIEAYFAQLAVLFPHSEHLRENRDRRLLRNCRELSVRREHQLTTVGFSDRHMYILDALTKPFPNYRELTERATTWEKDYFELATICYAEHARTSGQNLEAISAASPITSSSLYGRQASQIVLLSTRALMLKKEVRREDSEYYRIPMMAVVRFLAKHPEDREVRASFSDLLTVEACGEIGLSVIAATMLELTSAGVSLSKGHDESLGDLIRDDVKADEDATEAALMRCMEWIAERGFCEFGVTVVPRELVGTYADRVIRLITKVVLHAGGIEGEDTDLQQMSQIVLVASAVKPYAVTEREQDLRLLRMLAGHYTVAGHFQQARDLAEQILAIGQDTDVRRRLAWFAYADVYQRCRNPIDALVGLASAFAVDTVVEKADLWQEVYLVIRVLRELGMTELATKFLPALKRLMVELGQDPDSDLRILSTELGLRLKAISWSDSQGLPQLIDDIVKACGHVKDKSDVLPFAVLLGQVVLVADEVSISVPIEARSLLKSLLARIGASESDFVETASSSVPTAFQVISLFNNVQRAVHGIDKATDLEVVCMSARRLLTEQRDPREAIKAYTLAVELMADQTITLFGLPPLLTVDWALTYAFSLNDEGVDVAFIALNTFGELSVTVVSSGQTVVIEQPKHEKSFHQRMQAWLEKYPKAYGHIDSFHGNNEFFNSMQELDVRLPKSETLLIVAEPMLQQLTANLVVVQPEDGGFEYFYGSHTAVGGVPSLSWLSLTRARTRLAKGRYRAWISAASGPNAEGALETTLARLSGTFEQFGFSVDTNSRLPSDISDASLVVVTAHGGLGLEDRYLHSISDEDKLVETPSAMALSIAGVELVILFVCSGGRIDKHPFGNRTLGLPRQLLDTGTRAVIASPWPLDVKVTYNWFEPFMKAWNSGATVLHATKIANEVVANRLGNNPQYSLAMHAYGDVLMTK